MSDTAATVPAISDEAVELAADAIAEVVNAPHEREILTGGFAPARAGDFTDEARAALTAAFPALLPSHNAVFQTLRRQFELFEKFPTFPAEAADEAADAVLALFAPDGA